MQPYRHESDRRLTALPIMDKQSCDQAASAMTFSVLKLPSVPIVLDQNVRAAMEWSFGAHFSKITLRESLAPLYFGALAFAAGEQIYFTPGSYCPLTFFGRILLGHELAHIVQQNEGRTPVGSAGEVRFVLDEKLEAEAHRAGFQAARGERVT